MLGYVFYRQLVLGKPLGNHPMSNTGIAIIALTVALFVLWFYNLQLVTEVRDDALEVGFRLLFVRRTIPFDSILQLEARTYSPIRDYGGWGVRWRAAGMAYNVSGNRGVELQLANGRSLMIGSQRPEELVLALQKRMGK